MVQNATYSDYLCQILIHWKINKQIDVQMFYDFFAKSTTPAQGSVKHFYNHHVTGGVQGCVGYTIVGLYTPCWVSIITSAIQGGTVGWKMGWNDGLLN